MVKFKINWKKTSTKVVFVVFIALLILSGYFIINSYKGYIKNAEDVTLEKLKAISNTISLTLTFRDEDYLNTKFKNRTTKEEIVKDSVYIRVHEYLKKVYEINHLDAHISTLYRIENKDEFHYISTSDDSLYFGDPYIEYNSTFLDNYEKGDVIEQYTDEFGTWLTAFTPITDGKGNTAGIIEVDMRFDVFLQEANLQLYRNLIISIIIFIATTFFLLRYVRVVLVIEEDSKSKLEELYKVINEKNKEITDSINYAQRIQRSLLASDKLLNDNLQNYFVFFKPKDIVSGDFYWAANLNNGQFAMVTADSTGHGVPGAIMSMLNISCLKEAVKGQKLTAPNEILNYTRSQVIEHLSNDGSATGGKDGMDCAITSFDLKNNKITYAAANNPVWIVRKKQDNSEFELIEFVADKMPVGKHDRDSVSFNQQTIDVQKDDVVYTLTDGYADQFGGTTGKKFKYKQLKELLLSIAGKPMAEQKEILLKRFDDWKGRQEQVDDVLVIGVRI